MFWCLYSMEPRPRPILQRPVMFRLVVATARQIVRKHRKVIGYDQIVFRIAPRIAGHSGQASIGMIDGHSTMG